MAEGTVYWLTTAPNPKSGAGGYDAGQRGWRLHAVLLDPGESKFSEIGRRPALCGTSPAHGWSLDLYIDQRCARCTAKSPKD